MKTVRTNCFETNSSSTHSFTLDTSYSDAVFIPNDSFRGVEISAGEFGWEWRKFNDFGTKASYFWTLIADANKEYEEKYLPGLRARLERLAKKHGVVFLKPGEKDWTYVDHGSEHYENFVKREPSIGTDDGLWEFLTNPSYWIMLGNDNSEAPYDFRLTPIRLN